MRCISEVTQLFWRKSVKWPGEDGLCDKQQPTITLNKPLVFLERAATIVNVSRAINFCDLKTLLQFRTGKSKYE